MVKNNVKNANIKNVYLLILEQEELYTFDHYFGSQRRADEGELDPTKPKDFAEDGGFLCPSGISNIK